MSSASIQVRLDLKTIRDSVAYFGTGETTEYCAVMEVFGSQQSLAKLDPTKQEALLAGYAQFLNAGNQQAGGMVVEIMPGQTLPAPSVGEHIQVFGTWVLDTNNGWNEIHPVWGIKYLDTGSSAYSLPPVTPRYSGGSNS